MYVYSDANELLKATTLTSALLGSSGSPVGTISGLTATVETGTGDLFHDFSEPYFGQEWLVFPMQPVVLYQEGSDWSETAFLYDRTGDTLSFIRIAKGQEYGNSEVFETLPIGTKIAPRLSARMLKKFVQNELPVHISSKFVKPDSGVSMENSDSAAIGANAIATKNNSATYGPGGRCMVRDGVSIGGYPVIAKDDDLRASESCMTGVEGVVSTVSLSLSGGIPWVANTVYRHGTVFRADPDDGMQYTLYASSYDADQRQAESTTTEPSWTGVDWDYVDMDFDQVRPSEWAYMVSTDLEGAGYEINVPRGMTFYPTEIVFVCDEWAGITVAPKITVTVAGTVVLNNVAVDGITGAKQMKRWALTSNKGVIGSGVGSGSGDSIKFVLDDRATGTKMQGRFLVKGYGVEHMDNPPLSTWTA